MEDWNQLETTVGNWFLEVFVPIVEKRKNRPYTNEQINWQEIRRQRYVEFNLVHDNGALFGLKTSGRIESILMSFTLPVQWVNDYHPTKESEEKVLIKVLAHPKEWVKRKNSLN